MEHRKVSLGHDLKALPTRMASGGLWQSVRNVRGEHKTLGSIYAFAVAPLTLVAWVVISAVICLVHLLKLYAPNRPLTSGQCLLKCVSLLAQITISTGLAYCISKLFLIGVGKLWVGMGNVMNRFLENGIRNTLVLVGILTVAVVVILVRDYKRK